MDHGQPDDMLHLNMYGNENSYKPFPESTTLELLNASLARQQMFGPPQERGFCHYAPPAVNVMRPDGFDKPVLSERATKMMQEMIHPEIHEDQIYLTSAEYQRYLDACAEGFVGSVYHWIMSQCGTISIGVTSEAPAVSFDPVTHQHDSATNKDETVYDITKMAVTQENVSEMYALAKTAGYTGTIEHFIADLNKGTTVELPVLSAAKMNGPQGAAGRPMPNRSAGETEVSYDTVRQAQINQMIEIAADPATLQKLVTEKIIPTFTKALAELSGTYSGQDLLRQQRRVSDRLQKLLVYVSAPERIVGTCIHDVHELQIYKHYIATHVVAGTMSEAAGSQAIADAMEKLDARNAAMDAARAKDIKAKADAELISECRGSLRRVVGDNLAWDDVATTVIYLRAVASRLESTYKETPVETDMGMSYDTIVGAPEQAVDVPKRSDIRISLDPRDPQPEATVSAIQELCKGQAKNRYYLNGTQVGNDPYGHMGTAIEKQQRLDASIGETLKESPAMSAMQVHIDTMLKALGLTDLNMSGDNRNKLISHMLPSMASTMTLARSIPPARNNSMSLQDLFDSLHPAGACKKS